MYWVLHLWYVDFTAACVCVGCIGQEDSSNWQSVNLLWFTNKPWHNTSGIPGLELWQSRVTCIDDLVAGFTTKNQSCCSFRQDEGRPIHCSRSAQECARAIANIWRTAGGTNQRTWCSCYSLIPLTKCNLNDPCLVSVLNHPPSWLCVLTTQSWHKNSPEGLLV